MKSSLKVMIVWGLFLSLGGLSLHTSGGCTKTGGDPVLSTAGDKAKPAEGSVSAPDVSGGPEIQNLPPPPPTGSGGTAASSESIAAVDSPQITVSEGPPAAEAQPPIKTVIIPFDLFEGAEILQDKIIFMIDLPEGEVTQTSWIEKILNHVTRPLFAQTSSPPPATATSGVMTYLPGEKRVRVEIPKPANCTADFILLQFTCLSDTEDFWTVDIRGSILDVETNIPFRVSTTGITIGDEVVADPRKEADPKKMKLIWTAKIKAAAIAAIALKKEFRQGQTATSGAAATVPPVLVIEEGDTGGDDLTLKILLDLQQVKAWGSQTRLIVALFDKDPRWDGGENGPLFAIIKTKATVEAALKEKSALYINTGNHPAGTYFAALCVIETAFTNPPDCIFGGLDEITVSGKKQTVAINSPMSMFGMTTGTPSPSPPPPPPPPTTPSVSTGGTQPAPTDSTLSTRITQSVTSVTTTTTTSASSISLQMDIFSINTVIEGFPNELNGLVVAFTCAAPNGPPDCQIISLGITTLAASSSLRLPISTTQPMSLWLAIFHLGEGGVLHMVALAPLGDLVGMTAPGTTVTGSTTVVIHPP